jgi:hypothetical protein
MPAVNASERIGTGPWFNQRGQMVAPNVMGLLMNGIPTNLVIDEKGMAVPGNQHDITGSTPMGTPFINRTCNNWTSNAGNVQVQVGHSDGANSAMNRLSAHASTCSQQGLIATAGSGRTYCFATN